MTTKYSVEDKAGEFIKMGRLDDGEYDTRSDAEEARRKYVAMAPDRRDISDYTIVEFEA